MNKKRIIVFAPHPDDETLGCGGTITKKIREGYEVLLVILTDGRYAFKKVMGVKDKSSSEELIKIRKEEVTAAAKILGVPETSLIFLDFVDGTLEDNREEAEKRIIKILQEKNPDEIYVPYKKDFHPDHRATYKIVKNVVIKLAISPIFYQYSIAHKFGRLGRFLDFLLEIFIHKNRRIYVDVSEFLTVKKLAIEMFKSQLTIISNKHYKPVVSNIQRFTKGKELFRAEKIKAKRN
ncbi:MAG: PIG-L family deacetylase [Candidatus Bathyarchaeia archaeon]